MTDRSSVLLYPELVHADEGGRIFRLERMPGGETGHGWVLREAKSILRRDPRIELEADELQIVPVEKGTELRKCHMVLLDMEQEIATLADAEIVTMACNGFHGSAQELLASAPDIV